MAVKSELFLQLEARLIELEAKFLVDQLKAELQEPLSFKADLDQLAAFRLLIHAEIEVYLEQKAKQALQNLKGIINNSSFRIHENLYLFVIASIFNIKLPQQSPFDQPTLIETLNAVIREAEKFISENNGIKEQSFTYISLICGKMTSEIDVSLVEMLHQFGKGRGDVAHQSATRVRTIQAPSTERKNAFDLIKALEDNFD